MAGGGHTTRGAQSDAHQVVLPASCAAGGGELTMLLGQSGEEKNIKKRGEV